MATILHIAETLPGGIASYLQEILPAQQQQFGVQSIHLFAPTHTDITLPPAQHHTFRASRSRVLRQLQVGWQLWRAYRRLKPTIIHAHSSLAGVWARLLKPSNSQLIYCPHGWAFAQDTARWKRGLFAMIERQLARRTARIICISDHEYQHALHAGLPAKKLLRIDNGVSETPTVSAPLPARTGDHLQYLFVGRLDRQKGLDILLPLIAQQPHARLWVIGAPVRGDAPLPHTWPNNVDYLGWRSRAEINAYYQAADAVIIPSRWEGFGLVAIEAMRAGTAVIASRRGALPELVQHDETGQLFELENPAQLNALLTHNTRATLQRLGHASRNRYLAHFTSARLNAELAACYQQLLL